MRRLVLCGVNSEPFILTEADKAQNLWLRLRAHFEERLAVMRARNDDATLTEQATAAIRGEIGCLKKLIALGNDQPIVAGEE